MDLANKNVFITGANRGIGKAMALAAAKRKANVYALCRSEQKDLVSELKEAGAPHAEVLLFDASSFDKIESFFNYQDFTNKKIDIWINNAGQLTGGLIEEQKMQDVYSMLQVNLTAVIHLSQKVIQIMLKQNSGKIVNNSSVSGKMFLPCASTYAASKAGVVAFTEAIKQELRSTGVSTLLLITPGVKTRMYDDIEGLYGKNLKLDKLSSIPAETWANNIMDAIERDKDTLWPDGSNYFGVKLGHHFPKLLEKSIKSSFQRL